LFHMFCSLFQLYSWRCMQQCHQFPSLSNKTNSVAWVRQHELYRLSDHHLPAKLVPTLADRGCRMVSAMNPSVVNFGFLDQSRYFLEIASQLSSRGWVDPVPDPLLLRKSGSTGNQTQISESVARNSDH
jgi:hypothetical protein